MLDFELLQSAPERIRQHRMAAFDLHLIGPAGQPLTQAEVDIQLINHEFLFGCNAFGLHSVPEAALQQAYDERFAALFNYATLPFYWGSYEPEEDQPQIEKLASMADWCYRRGIKAKGHPLIWHEVFPSWAESYSDIEVVQRLGERVRSLPAEFRGFVQYWDVVNEATVAEKFNNPVGRWIARQSPAAIVDQALRWARQANPQATLIYNDFNISPAFEYLVVDLLARGAPLDALGIQSHMHQAIWPLKRAWAVCETYSYFGLPLHFTELTVLSGRLKPMEETDWHARHTDWLTTPAGERAQMEYGVALYTLLFSHPAVQAITWWDFADYHSWQDAPAGLLRQDMSPKPFYERLQALIKGEWATHFHGVSDAQGIVKPTCTYGLHQIRAHLPSGEWLKGEFTAGRRETSLTVALSR